MLIIGQNIDNEMMLCFQPILTTEEGGDTQLWSIDQEGHISPWLEPNLVLLVTAGEVMLGRRGGGQDNWSLDTENGFIKWGADLKLMLKKKSGTIDLELARDNDTGDMNNAWDVVPYLGKLGLVSLGLLKYYDIPKNHYPLF